VASVQICASSSSSRDASLAAKKDVLELDFRPLAKSTGKMALILLDKSLRLNFYFQTSLLKR
jgi:hypothetical protein